MSVHGLEGFDGFQIEGSRASRIARWFERREARAFEQLVTQLRRKMQNRGVCRHCGREVGLLPGELVTVARYHFNTEGMPCIGRGRQVA
jgi:hypothetical protein